MSLNARDTVVMRLLAVDQDDAARAPLADHACRLDDLGLSQSAATYPAETIRIVVPFGPASGPDFAIRALQPTLQEILKQSVRVENRPGANSIIGTRAVATAAPDGYTLLGASTGFSTIESTTSQPGFSPMRDFKPVGFSARSAGYVLVVSAKSPYATMAGPDCRGKEIAGLLWLARHRKHPPPCRSALCGEDRRAIQTRAISRRRRCGSRDGPRRGRIHVCNTGRRHRPSAKRGFEGDRLCRIDNAR